MADQAAVPLDKRPHIATFFYFMDGAWWRGDPGDDYDFPRGPFRTYDEVIAEWVFSVKRQGGEHGEGEYTSATARL